MVVLRVLEIFDSLQGEGYWTGIPMTFVRLAGCNAPELGLGCTGWCDTRESWNPTAGEDMEVGEIARRVHLPRLCLTGGEPLLQGEGVAWLAGEAQRRSKQVHVETNGTVDPPAVNPPASRGRVFAWVTVSPKPPGYEVAPGWEGLVDELKLVADKHLDAATAERVAAAHPEAVVFIQPEWDCGAGIAQGLYPSADADRVAAGTTGDDASKRGVALGPSRVATERATALVLAHQEWRLSLQMHRFLGIR